MLLRTAAHGQQPDSARPSTGTCVTRLDLNAQDGRFAYECARCAFGIFAARVVNALLDSPDLLPCFDHDDGACGRCTHCGAHVTVNAIGAADERASVVIQDG